MMSSTPNRSRCPGIVGGQVLLPAECQRGPGVCADHRRVADAAARRRRPAPTRRSFWPITPPRYRSCSSRSTARRCRNRSCSTLGNNVVRTGLTHGAGCGAAVSLWRQAAPGAGRSSIPRRCAPRACRPPTSATRSALQNLIIPAGTEKIGDIEYNVKLNSTPAKPAELNDVPIRTVNGTVVFVRDVANVHDGASSADQPGARATATTRC